MSKTATSADTIAENIRRLMHHLDLSQAELGRRSGVAQTLLSGLLSREQGSKKNPTSSTVDKLADYFQISPWKLLVPGISVNLLLSEEIQQLVENFAQAPLDGRQTILRIAEAEVRYNSAAKPTGRSGTDG